MRRILLWAMGTVVVLVLLFTYRTSTSATSEATAQIGAVRAAVGSGAQTYAGQAVAGHYGPVQVQITVSGGKITSASTVQVPGRNPHDVEVNGRAVPILNREVVDSQSADIDMVSGATVTSTAYLESLQSAIDQANL